MVASLAWAGPPARADFVATQGFAIGPNGLSGSASFGPWAVNAVQGIRDGFRPVGDFATDPSAFRPITSFRFQDLVTTSDFHSWRGSASPTGAFANELGNLLFTPVDIVDQGGKFSLSQVVFTGLSSDNPDPGNPGASLLGSVLDLKNFSYNAGRVGLIHNADGSITTITSGSSDQLVDEIVYRGVGAFDRVLAVAGSGMTPQELIDAEIARFARFPNLSFSANYTIYKDNVSRDPGSVLFSTTASIGVVPEPASVVLTSIGVLAALGLAQARRRRAG